MSHESTFPGNRLAVFEEMAAKQFAYLENRYGFMRLPVNRWGVRCTLVEYRSEKVYVRLYYGPPEYELEHAFGRVGIDDQEGCYSFSFAELCLLDDCEDRPDSIGSSGFSYAKLCANMSRLAASLRDYGDACLRGDDATYELMAARP